MAALGLAGVALAGGRLALADGYSAPSAPQCALSAPIRLAEAGGCLSIDGGTGLDYGTADKPGDIRLTAGRIDFAGATEIGPARLAGALRLSSDATTWAYAGADDPPPGFSPQSLYAPSAGPAPSASWQVDTGRQRIEAAYLAASAGKSFVAAGLVDRSVADTGDDRPYSPLPSLSTAAAAEGVGLPDAPDLAGTALQFVSRLDGAGLIGLGLENLASTATAVASWSYAAGFGSGHVTLLGPDIFGGSLERVGFHTGATLKASPLAFRAALAGDGSGWLDGLATSEATFGGLRVAASGQYLRNSTLPSDPASIGCAVSASASLDDQIALNAAINWVHDLAEETDSTQYELGLALTTPLGEKLELSQQLGLSGADDGLAVPYGRARLALEPEDGGPALSAAISASADRSYSLTTVASRSFD